MNPDLSHFDHPIVPMSESFSQKTSKPALRAIAACLLLVAVSAHSVAAQQDAIQDLRDSLNAILEDAGTPNALWAIRVLRTDDGHVLYDRNGYTSFIPASNTKLYTTAAALDVLGPDFRYETSLFATGPVVDGILKGSLVVRGSGDPVIGGRFTDGDLTQTFREWAAALRSAGITRIDGDIIGDDDAFDDVPLGYSWSWDDEPFWYSAEIGALSFNDNCIDFSLQGSRPGEPAVLSWEPSMTSYASVVNASVTTGPETSIDEGYERTRDGNEYRLYSSVPAGRTDYESLTVRNPTLYFVHVLRETLLSEGIPVAGSPKDIDDLSIKPTDDALRVIATHASAPLSDIIHVINKRSQNLYAEQVLKTMGIARAAAEGRGASARDGVRSAMPFFGSARIDTTPLQLVDGSGLSRLNLVTADMTTDLLQFMAHRPDSSLFALWRASLPIAGVDGTLQYRMRGTAAEGNLRAKTGTLGSASALSGYVTTAAGEELTFSVMVNHYTGPTANVRATQDALGAALAGFQRSTR